MAKQKSANSLTKQYAYLKRRISKNQAKAKFVGVLYLLGLFAIVALSCMQLVTLEGVTLGATSFWKVFTSANFGAGIVKAIKANFIPLFTSALYGLMLLIMLFCVIKSICSLNWLFKRKASKLYGFNRNAYAMDDMGRYFSRAFASAVIFHFLIAIVAGGKVTLSMLAYALLGAGLFFHFLCGTIGGTVSLFSTDGELYEEKREVGSFAPFVRNLFQIALTAVAVYFFVKGNTLREAVDKVLTGGIGALTKDMPALIMSTLQLAIALWLSVMVGYIVSNKEYDPDGADATGRKSYLWLSLLLLLTAGGAFAYAKAIAKIAVDTSVLIIAGVAFVGFVIELCLINLPKNKYAQSDEVETGLFIKENYDKPGVYLPDER